ncbi:MAG: enoyl-CoA hydratase/isomerase family protein, partial [Terrimesophilobacter sp.]
MGAEQTTGAPPTEPVLLLDRRGDILIATLNRPRKGNALSTELILELGELTKQLRDEYADVKVVVLTGRGEKVFSAGADITNLVGL